MFARTFPHFHRSAELAPFREFEHLIGRGSIEFARIEVNSRRMLELEGVGMLHDPAVGEGDDGVLVARASRQEDSTALECYILASIAELRYGTLEVTPPH